MVVGMDRFKEHFKGYEKFFVVIGGAACDEWFTHEGLSFRATKDVDIVLLLEASHTQFVARFWEFISAGNYSSHQCSSGDKIYYRFMGPEVDGFPEMLELFSRVPLDLVLFEGQQIVPIPAEEEVASLSAILLDDIYYQVVAKRRDVVRDLSVVRPDVLILLKAKAWLDLSERKSQGERIDTTDIKKHRNDVFRLAHILPVGESISIPGSVFDDLHRFLESFPESSGDWQAIIASVSQTINPPMNVSDLIDLFRRHFRRE